MRAGQYADLTLFDPQRVRDRATYENPFQYSEGIEYVIVNGQVVLDKGKHTGARPSKALRHQSQRISNTSADGDVMLPSKISLIDRSQLLVDCWKAQFSDCPGVETIAGDYFQRSAGAIVSPANSFGILDGGLDLAIREQLGFSVESKVQEVIDAKYHGELPVGWAEMVETDDPRWRYLIVAPTMRIPEPIPFTINAYLAFRAILVAVKNYNNYLDKKAIDSLVCCGLGTGIGKVSPNKCAMQMRAAYQVMKKPPQILSFQGIHEFHQTLLQM